LFTKIALQVALVMTSQWEIRHHDVNVHHCIEGVRSKRLFLYTLAIKESNVNMRYFLWNDLHVFVLILWLALFTPIWNFYAKIYSFHIVILIPPLICLSIYWQMSGDVLIVCKHCECSGSSGIVSKTNSWILILHIFIHLKR
jgi:hypothetical protein